MLDNQVSEKINELMNLLEKQAARIPIEESLINEIESSLNSMVSNDEQILICNSIVKQANEYIGYLNNAFNFGFVTCNQGTILKSRLASLIISDFNSILMGSNSIRRIEELALTNETNMPVVSKEVLLAEFYNFQKNTLNIQFNNQIVEVIRLLFSFKERLIELC